MVLSLSNTYRCYLILSFFLALHQDVTSMMETCYGQMGSLFRSGK